MSNTKTVIRQLPVDLSVDELATKGERLAACEVYAAELRKQKSDFVKEMNEQIQEQLVTIQELAHAIDAKEELRDVDCTESMDFERGQYSLIRDDTGEEIEARELTDAERQGSLV
jgi:hypothetical protein